MIDPNSGTSPVIPAADDWSVPAGDLLIAPGQVLGVRLRGEQIGGPFVAILAEIPTGIRSYFKLADVAIGDCSVVDPPYSLDPGLVHFGQWLELGRDMMGHVQLAVSCVVRSKPMSQRASQMRFRGVVWLRDASGRLWGEAVGWVGQQAVDSFTAWCSR